MAAQWNATLPSAAAGSGDEAAAGGWTTTTVSARVAAQSQVAEEVKPAAEAASGAEVGAGDAGEAKGEDGGSGSPKAAFRYTPVVKYGFMYKRGCVNGRWNKRWCEARSQMLTYYSSRKAKTVKGQISLVDCRVDLHYDSEKGNCLAIYLPSKKVILLSPALEVEMMDWLVALQSCVVESGSKVDFFQRAVVPERTRDRARGPFGLRQQAGGAAAPAGKDRASLTMQRKGARVGMDKKVRHSSTAFAKVGSDFRFMQEESEDKEELPKTAGRRRTSTALPQFSVAVAAPGVVLSGPRQAQSRWKDVLPDGFELMSRKELLVVLEGVARDYTDQTAEMEELQLSAVQLVGSMKVTMEKLLQSNGALSKELMMKEASMRERGDTAPEPSLAAERTRSHTLAKMMEK